MSGYQDLRKSYSEGELDLAFTRQGISIIESLERVLG